MSTSEHSESDNPVEAFVSTESQNPSSSQDSPSDKSKVPVNCTKAFDRLYFCYSPFNQARHYYITGELDSCRGKLRRFRMCVLSRFRPQEQSEVLYEEDDRLVKKAKGLENVKPVWELRDDYLENIARAEHEETQNSDSQQEDNQTKWWL